MTPPPVLSHCSQNCSPAIQLAVCTPHSPCSPHTLHSLHSLFFSYLRLTLSKYLSHSFTVFYFSTLLFYRFCTLSALCTAHIHSVLQLLVSGQLKNTRQPHCSTRTAVRTVPLPSPVHSQIAACPRSVPFHPVQYNSRYQLLLCCPLCYENSEIFCIYE